MRKHLLLVPLFLLTRQTLFPQTLVYHNLVTDANKNIQPWYSPDLGASYDHCLGLVWNFWKNIPTCCGGNKFYMMDHSYSTQSSGNKVGGDQFAMALSSWALLYAYTGDTDVVKDMRYIADTYLANSLSPPTAQWPNIPYPCNYSNSSGAVYDGDYLLGAGYTQPDKAGSFGAELISLYKITGDTNYLGRAIDIANTLSFKVSASGTSSKSPLPYKVNAINGQLPSTILCPQRSYTADWVPTLRLFEGLSSLGKGNTVQYDTGYAVLKRWIQTYPMSSNDWGPFFEDIYPPSITETNAVTMARYILEKGTSWSTTWQQDARGILDNTINVLGSHVWDTCGVTVLYEQTADLKEGGSHTSRFGAAELLYTEKTGDTTNLTRGIRQLSWATYLVDFDGSCRFSPRENSIWYTDGYGDFVRHFLRAMASHPEIAPDSSNHLLGSASVITYVKYQPGEIVYSTFDTSSMEVLRVTSQPSLVKANGVVMNQLGNLNAEGWTWTPLSTGGILRIRHDASRNIDIIWNSSHVQDEFEQRQISLYPNPATESIVIKSLPGSRAEIFDVVGRRVMETARFESMITLDISGLREGTYFVKTFSGNRPASVKKLVISR